MKICSKCGAEIPQGARFCMECGTPVPQTPVCPNCGMELMPGAKFCMNCGTPLSESSQGGISMGDANAINAQNVVGGNQEIVQGNKEVVQGNKVVAENYTVNNITHEAGFGQNVINVEKIREQAEDAFEDEKYKKAFELFNRIADKDDVAQYYLGCCFELGYGTAQNDSEAFKWYKLAAENGNADAQCELGVCFYTGKYNVTKDDALAFNWFQKAAQQGQSNAQSNLAAMYYYGKGTEVNVQESFKWHQRAAKEHEFVSQVAMGVFYYEGECVKQNIEKAFDSFVELLKYKSLDLDDDEWFDYDRSIICSGWISYADICIRDLNGHGNYAEGVKFLEIAKSFGSKEAEEYLEKLDNEKSMIRVMSTSYYGHNHVDGYGLIYSDDLTTIEGYNKNKGLCMFNQRDLVIPEGATTIDDYAFGSCELLESVIIPGTVKNIGSNAFIGCINLKTVTIPNSVTSIGESAFHDCKSLSSINIPNSVTNIGKYAFSDCASLSSITIPNSVTNIEDCTFYNCSCLVSVNIPNSVTSIGYSAFDGCSSLVSITIPNSVTSIEDSAFNGCRSLASITIPNSVKDIEDKIFYNAQIHSLVLRTTSKLKDYYFLKDAEIDTLYVPQSLVNIVKDEVSDYNIQHVCPINE